MADEFAKGFAVLVTAGLGWMTFAGWFNTPSFEEKQFIVPNPNVPGVYGEMALVIKDVLVWFAFLGVLTFWVVIPAYRVWTGRHADHQHG